MLALYNGKFYVNGYFEEALLVDDRKIKAIGSSSDILAMVSDNDEKINLDGRLAMPGFIDSHAHGPLSFSYTAGKIDLYSGESEADYLRVIKKYVDEHPDVEIYS